MDSPPSPGGSVHSAGVSPPRAALAAPSIVDGAPAAAPGLDAMRMLPLHPPLSDLPAASASSPSLPMSPSGGVRSGFGRACSCWPGLLAVGRFGGGSLLPDLLCLPASLVPLVCSSLPSLSLSLAAWLGPGSGEESGFWALMLGCVSLCFARAHGFCCSGGPALLFRGLARGVRVCALPLLAAPILAADLSHCGAMLGCGARCCFGGRAFIFSCPGGLFCFSS